ncbi:MAG TPA: flagellar hook-length control protein FliK [Lachnospiraceae bacterium]|nr:flagellar hook-length control protein FliK [Lachnospiraceae bacterium]
MKLSDFFSSSANKIQESGSVTENTQNVTSDRIPKQIQVLTPGKVLQGEVIEKSGNEVMIRLAGDLLLAARLDQEVNVEEGRLLTFEVKNNGKTVSLSPLFANTASTDNVMKALHMANIPINENTVEMTELMMRQGMSVDSHSLQYVFKDVAANGQIPVSQIVKLHQMEIPVNEANLGQLKSYLDMTHHLIDGMEEVIASIPNTFDEICKAQGDEKAILLYDQIIGDFFPGKSQKTAGMGFHNLNSLFQVLKGAVNNVETEQPPFLTQQEIYTVSVEPQVDTRLLTDILSDMQNIDNAFTKEGNILTEEANKTNIRLLRNLVHVMRDPTFIKMIKEEFKNEWTMLPEEVSDKEHVQEMYDRVRRQLESLKSTLENNGAGQSTMAKEVTNLRQNIDFMNQLNQLYTYIQLPLRMSHKATNGELYVFTNKRSLVKENGLVSALLHLNMEYLGMIDVYIAMQNNKVNTRFTVADDGMLDFLNQHMDVLSNRLSQKGYSLNCEMKVMDRAEAKQSPIELLSEAESKGQIIAQYAFDVRA